MNRNGVLEVHKPEHVVQGMDKKITGEGPVAGFVLELALLKI